MWAFHWVRVSKPELEFIFLSFCCFLHGFFRCQGILCQSWHCPGALVRPSKGQWLLLSSPSFWGSSSVGEKSSHLNSRPLSLLLSFFILFKTFIFNKHESVLSLLMIGMLRQRSEVGAGWGVGLVVVGKWVDGHRSLVPQFILYSCSQMALREQEAYFSYVQRQMGIPCIIKVERNDSDSDSGVVVGVLCYQYLNLS